MASDKKRRKAAKQAKNPGPPATLPFRHPDGDRRHKGMGKMVRDAYKTKDLKKLIGLPPLEPAEPDE